MQKILKDHVMAPCNEALAAFELDPRGKPEFTPVFIQQEHLAATVGMTVWFHTIYLLYILSSVNHIYGKSRAYTYLPFSLKSRYFQFSQHSSVW